MQAAHKGTIIGGGSYLDRPALDARPGDGTSPAQTVQQFVLSVVDLDDDSPAARLIDVTFLVHAIAVDPNRQTRIACFEKHGPGGCLIDLAAMRIERTITTSKTRQFYGHGSFSANGSLLYAAESYLNDKLRGALIVRDAKTLQVLGELPSYGAAPHDCQLLDDGKVMAVTNGGGPLRGGSPPNVAFVDLASERLLDKVELPEPRFNAGHLALSSRGDLALVSAPREGLPNPARALGAVSLKPAGAPLRTMRKPKVVVQRMKGETLSVVIDERRDRVMATHPAGDMVTQWELRSGKLRRRYDDFKGPCGVCLTLDGEHYVISHVMDGLAGLSLVTAADGEPVPSLAVQHTMTSGSHVFTHDLRAAMGQAA